MKKALLLVCLSLLSVTSFSQVNLDSGLIAYYPFDYDVKDYSGNSYHGTGRELQQAKDRFGKLSAVNFTGITQGLYGGFPRLFVPFDSAHNFDSVFSISMWVKLDPDYILGPLGFITSSGFPYDVGMGYDKDSGFTCWFPRAKLNIPISQVNFDDDTWHHFVMISDVDSAKLYVDDVMLISDIIDKSPKQKISGYLNFSTNTAGVPEIYQFDDLRLYDRPINRAEVTDLFGSVIYKPKRTNTVSGTLYADLDSNCTIDAGDLLLPYQIVKAEPGPYYTTTNKDGKYIFKLPQGNFNIIPQVNLDRFNGLEPTCPTGGIRSVNFNGDSLTESNVNFGFKAKTCARIKLNMTMGKARRCKESEIVIWYYQTAFDTTKDASIKVTLPNELTLVSASKTYTKTGNDYTFNIGDVGILQQGRINISYKVDCNSTLGDKVCVKAIVTPSNDCKGTTPKDWDGSDIEVYGSCYLDSTVKFSIVNNGIGDMEDSLQYRLYVDSTIALKGNFKLKTGENLPIEFATRNYHYYLEADQNQYYPGIKLSSYGIDDCGENNFHSKGYFRYYPKNEKADEVEMCREIKDSYDPNEKEVRPSGIGEKNMVRPGVPLHYTIHFQNTGNDTAYKVVLVDTLSKALDLLTLEVKGATHNFEYSLKDYVLTFTFNDINLVDSTTNELGSKGFISFKIKPVNGILLGSEVENNADIYFDFNDPIRTNTTIVSINKFHPEGNGFLGEVKIGDKVLSVYTEKTDESFKTLVYPNPASESFTLKLSDVNSGDYNVVLMDINGKVINTQEITINSNSAEANFNVNGLADGVYYITIRGTQTKNTLKIVISH